MEKELSPLQKKFREFFEELLGFEEFDLSNAAFKIVAHEFKTLKDKIKKFKKDYKEIVELVEKNSKSIQYYAENREEVFKDSLDFINVKYNSKKGKELRAKMKIEFLSMLFGKNKITFCKRKTISGV